MATPRKSLEPYLKDEVEFYPHQVDGIRTLARIPHFLLADQMGLGKSLQALTVFCIDVKLGRARTCLVVCPVSLRGNWYDEVTKFTRLPVLLLGQEPHPSKPGQFKMLGPKARSEQFKDFVNQPGPRVVVCNYEQVVAHHTELQWMDFVVFDEAHYIKNPDSQRTRAALKLRHRKRTALMTGTPVLNNVGELWPILHMIDPQRWPNFRKFLNRYATFGGYEGRQITGQKNVAELNRALAPVMMRRLKRDVLTLPEPKIMQIPVELHPDQRKMYDDLADELILEIDGQAQEIDNALVKFLRLKQICGSPATLPGNPDNSYKLDRAIEIGIETILNGEKVVYFTQFRGVQQLLVERLEKNGVKEIAQLHGDIPTHDRQRVVKEWSNHPGPIPIVCMLQVAGVGLNMTAARTGIFVDKLFTPGMNNQAIDRLHRIGQQETQPVEIYEIIARNTIESRIEEILKVKNRNSRELVEETVSLQNLMAEIRKSGGL